MSPRQNTGFGDHFMTRRDSDQAFPAPVHTGTSIITFSNAKTFLNAFLHCFLTSVIAISIVNKALLIAFG